MSVSVHQQMSAPQMPGGHPVAMSRPQVSIERLPTRRMSNEPRESMNCKSCRKRKIKCNRRRPACEACHIFQCPCIYDAVPKKRGPKTDVLEALLKRVDGLEAKLKDKNAEQAGSTPSPDAVEESSLQAQVDQAKSEASHLDRKRLAVDTNLSPAEGETAVYTPTSPGARESSPPPVPIEVLLDTYFNRFRGKPYAMLDESSVRQRLQLEQLPEFLAHAILAVAARYHPHPRGYQTAVRLSEEYAAKSRSAVDDDDPTVDGLQALLLLVLAFTAAGKGKKAYMILSTALGMAAALELHRELDAHATATPTEREMRRRLFWSCYLLDRYMACGSKRPSLISDKSIILRLPCWSPNPSAMPTEGEFFQCGSNLQYLQGSGKKSQGSTGMLIDITRILGVTNRYLAAGGVKGDSHFPWHSLSTLSKIRQDLDTWASGTDDMFSSLDTLFGQTESTILVMSKLVYHLIHCLIYRPFLPIDLAELAGNGQHQSWQIEATNMCFLHANAITELIELGNQASTIEWPAFIGYCICTAGTVHIHGAHYSKQGNQGEPNVFSSATDFLSREMQQLSELRYAWASVQHQRETLQGIYNAHAELVKIHAGSTTRYAPGFHLDDFFDRYTNIGGPGGPCYHFDAASLSLSDVVVDFTADSYTGHDLYAPRTNSGPDRPGIKRRNTASAVSSRKRPDLKEGAPFDMPLKPVGSVSATIAQHRQSFSHPGGVLPQQSPALLTTPSPSTGLHSSEGRDSQHGHQLLPPTQRHLGAGRPAHSGLSQDRGGPAHNLLPMGQVPFPPAYNYIAASGSQGLGGPAMNGEQGGTFDPMFGTLSHSAFDSPAGWVGGDAHNPNKSMDAVTSAPVGPMSPGTRSNQGSPGTAQGDEKDPFLSLLEQLAENEQRYELDFFLNGPGAA